MTEDNVIPFSKSFVTKSEEELITEEEIKELNSFVIKNMDEIVDKIRNTTTVTGAMVVLFDEEGRTDNYIMGSIAISRLYTTLELYKRNLLDMYAVEGD